MNDITEVKLYNKSNELSIEKQEDIKVLINNDLPGPVRDTWMYIKDKELYIIRENSNRSVFTNEYYLRDTKIEIINFINYTWEDLQKYKLPANILNLFKKRLERLYSKVQ